MMTLEELTSWRVAAIEGKLPEPVRSGRWQPLRAGVVNLWEYDAAEVWYADGRMQLQGANESGKSTLMTLTTLLLLAGEITSHNIDTLGQNDKRFRYYVEPTDHPLERRDTGAQKNRGWAWLEFGRGAQADREADFFTVLLFAETRRADTNMTVSWCTLSGQTRVRSGLSLATTGLVADPARFKEVPGFMAHPTGTAYRETIARVLYDTDEAWLNQLNRILRVVRTPQIGHKIDLKFLTRRFAPLCPRSRRMRSTSSRTAGNSCSACGTSATRPTRRLPRSPTSADDPGGPGQMPSSGPPPTRWLRRPAP